MADLHLATVVLWVTVGVIAGLTILGLGYLAACAGAERWLKFREWWGTKRKAASGVQPSAAEASDER